MRLEGPQKAEFFIK